MFKKILVVSVVALASGASVSLVAAQESGRVLSSTPVVQQVSVPRRVCTTEQVATQPQKSGAGAVIGAIAGGAAGNAVGQGNGRAVATMIGLVGGAIVGDKIEGAPAGGVENVQRCSNQNFLENRTLGYNVVYEFAGRQYSAQFPNDPGPFVQLQITPVGAVSQLAPEMAPQQGRRYRYRHQ